MLRALFADAQAWRRLPAAAIRVTDGAVATPMRAAAYPAMA